MKKNSKSAGDANETIKWKRILKVREMLAWQSNEKEFLKVREMLT